MAWNISSQLQEHISSHVPHFWKKIGFLTLTICFISATRDIYTKLLIFSEFPVKIEVRPAQTFFVILLTSAVICKQRFWMETKLCNIFKTTNTITLTETVIKSTYKVLDSSWKRTTLKRPEQFWKAPFNFQLLLAFKLLWPFYYFNQTSEVSFFIHFIKNETLLVWLVSIISKSRPKMVFVRSPTKK